MLLACYLTAGAVLLVLRQSRVYPGGLLVHLLVLGVILMATLWPRTPAWLRAWTPLIALLFLYTEIPMLIRAAGHGRFFDMTVMSWETALFRSQPAIEWSLRWPSRALSEALHAAYLAYYPIIFSVPAALWLRRRREQFAEAVFALMLTFVTCFVCYVAFPVEGPRYLWPTAAEGGPLRRFTLWLLEARSSRGTAFPSSHVAVACAQSVLAFRYFGAKGWLVAIPTVGLAFGAIYGGFHYAVDVIAGGLTGILAVLTGLELFALFRGPDQAKATAPTNPASAPLPVSDSSTSSSGTAST